MTDRNLITTFTIDIPPEAIDDLHAPDLLSQDVRVFVGSLK